MGVECYDETGSINSSYRLFWWLGWLFIALYPLGIPAVLGWKLYQNRDSIAKNPDYTSLAAIKPLFIFYKPQVHTIPTMFLTP